MDKTALQMLIEALQAINKELGESTDKLTRFQKGRITDAIIGAKKLIAIERQQIEEAFKTGFKEGELEVQDYNPNYYNAEDYYQSKYTESKGEKTTNYYFSKNQLL